MTDAMYDNLPEFLNAPDRRAVERIVKDQVVYGAAEKHRPNQTMLLTFLAMKIYADKQEVPVHLVTAKNGHFVLYPTENKTKARIKLVRLISLN
jgi:hypothetical protein